MIDVTKMTFKQFVEIVDLKSNMLNEYNNLMENLPDWYEEHISFETYLMARYLDLKTEQQYLKDMGDRV